METVIPTDEGVVKSFIKMNQEQPDADKVAEQSDEQIGQLSVDPRWVSFKNVIDGMIQTYEQQLPIDVTDTPESIGFRYMTGRLIAGALKAVRDLPDAIAEGAKQDGQPG